jgi:hypothetical protein
LAELDKIKMRDDQLHPLFSADTAKLQMLLKHLNLRQHGVQPTQERPAEM